ncbi:MAG: glutamate-cysteine ligase family protein [Gemmatimonadota bacterium]
MSRLDPGFLRRSVEQLFESPAASTSGLPGAVGIEVELIPVRPPAQPPGADSDAVLDAIAARTDAAGRFTFEPGGQIEYSGPVCATLAEAVDDVDATLAGVREQAHAAGLELRARGLAPWFTPDQIGLRRATPRYREMDRYFSRIGPWGRWMMRLSASQQVNLDFGGLDETEARWRTANALTPLLVAAFANSPAVLPDGSLVAAGRWWVWRCTDGTRTGRPGDAARGRLDPAIDTVPPWSEYLTFALAAPVMFDAAIRPVTLDGEPAPRFADWWNAAGDDGPTEADWRAHLGTLFPDVRPRHWMEIRAVDVPEPAWWPVPPAVLAALLYDARAAAAVDEVLGGPGASRADLCERAIRSGLRDEELRAAARRAFALAEAAMDRFSPDWFGERARGAVGAFRERFVETGRTQADEARERGEVVRLDEAVATTT